MHTVGYRIRGSRGHTWAQQAHFMTAPSICSSADAWTCRIGFQSMSFAHVSVLPRFSFSFSFPPFRSRAMTTAHAQLPRIVCQALRDRSVVDDTYVTRKIDGGASEILHGHAGKVLLLPKRRPCLSPAFQSPTRGLWSLPMRSKRKSHTFHCSSAVHAAVRSAGTPL